MEQDITFYDRLQISRDTSKPKTSFWDTTARKIDLEFMKDQKDETPIKKI